MTYHERRPPLSLSHIVRYFWAIEERGSSGASPQTYRLLAESSPSLAFFPVSGHCILAGQTFRQSQMSIAGEFLMIGACIYPDTVPMLYGMPTRLLRDTFVQFADLEPVQAPLLMEQIDEATTIDLKVQVLIDYLHRKSAGVEYMPRGMHGCVHAVVKAGGLLPVQKFVGELGVSERQAERNFHHYVGYSPKQFSRVLRFQTSLRYATTRSASLTQIAHDCGYADQSHFIREFREFSGMSPRKYFTLPDQYRADNFVRIV